MSTAGYPEILAQEYLILMSFGTTQLPHSGLHCSVFCFCQDW